MEKVKLGIIGCGIASRDLHYPALKKLQDKFEIALVCNHTKPKAISFSDLAGGVPYTLDYKEVLSNPEIAAVTIALPIELNYKVAKDAMKAGKHIILEKPLAVNLNEAGALVKLSVNYRKVFLIAENFRYRQVFHAAKKHIQNGDIGKVYSAVWNVFSRIDEKNNKYAQTKWRQRHKYAGGFITDAGVHNIAALRFILGDIASGSAFAGSVNKKIGGTDTFSMHFAAKSGVTGIFNMFFSVSGYYEDKLLIMGTKGTAEITANQLKLYSEGKEKQVEKWDEDSGYYEEFSDFYNAIVNKKKHISPAKEAYKDLEVILKALQSAEQGKKFKIS